MNAQSILQALGLEADNPGAAAGGFLPAGSRWIESFNPATGELLGRVSVASEADYEAVVRGAQEAFVAWRRVPAPVRGEVVRQIGLELREHKEALGGLVSLEMGKILQEGLGEVQEMIDIADFAVGLSRQLYGLTMHSERPLHRMYEQWHPMGPVGIITAFNFPVAVWSWNAMLALVCGDTLVWKPSELTPLCAVAVQKMIERVLVRCGQPAAISGLVTGGRDLGERIARDPRLPLVSATGSCAMGRAVGEAVAARLGRSLLELGGNNAIVVMDDADLDLATRAILFGAVGTAGQRCTTTRRAIVQRGVAGALAERLVAAYGQVRVGDPLVQGTLMGPLVNEAAAERMMSALQQARAQGGEVLTGGERLRLEGRLAGGAYVQPTIVRARPDMPIVREETFAPILYLLEFDGLEDAIALQNDVPQGLSSAIFTRGLQSAEAFLSVAGSDCGIANVNIGTSGAEIGGAFGGEKDTGGGREAGSDSWKAYMRRQTCTINYSSQLPLAQGIQFG